tara:strand:- start:2078 stop:3199 length:1122 start_codon:yes stop_codon:yes gene_type:complete
MGSDDRTYDEVSKLISKNYKYHYFDALKYFWSIGRTDPSYWYTSFLVQIYTILNKFSLEMHTLVPRFINSFCLGLISIIMYSMSKKFELNKLNGICVALLSSLWSTIIWHSSTVRRDTFILLGLVLLVNGLVGLIQKKYHYKNILFIMLGTGLVLTLRPTNFFIICFTYLGFQFYIIISRYFTKKISILILTLITIFPIIILFQVFSNQYTLLLKDLYLYSQKLTNEENQGFSFFIFSQPLILQIPLKLIYANIAPLPIPTLSIITQNIRWVGTLFWLLNLPFLINLILKQRNKKNSLEFLLLVFIVLFLSINLSTFTETHQMLYYPFGIILIFIERNRLRSMLDIYLNQYRLFGVFSCLIGVFLYISLKVLI